MKIKELTAQRAKALADMEVLANKEGELPEEEQKKFDALKAQVDNIDVQIANVKAVNERLAAGAQPAAGQVTEEKVFASVENDVYVKDKSLVVGGFAKMLGLGSGNIYNARQASKDVYGENHPVTKALQTSTGPAGGYVIPSDYMASIVELLRAQTVVRPSGPTVIPMPHGNMRLPAQASAATAGYGAEGAPTPATAPSFAPIVASFKKLTAFVPVSNDMMRYASPAIDGVVRNDIVKQIALAEDYAFLNNMGTTVSPTGFLGFANNYAVALGGTAGAFSTSAASAWGAGGQFITSTAAYTLTTVNNELMGAINKLDAANIPDSKRTWFMNPRTKNFLLGLQNSLGLYVYRDELSRGLLLGYPVKTTTQILTNYLDPTATNKDCSFVMLVEMSEDMIFDSMQMEMAVSSDGAYQDSGGNWVSAFQADQTLIRAICEHDHQMRHTAAAAIIQGVCWSPADV